jgi:hypothetical protein
VSRWEQPGHDLAAVCHFDFMPGPRLADIVAQPVLQLTEANPFHTVNVEGHLAA